MKLTDKNIIDKYYKALINKDSDYLGIFFVGVKTTSVFCIPTCRARKPKKENVEFYKTYKDALENGYRPCKICNPTENANKAPKEIEQAINLIKENPKKIIKDFELRKMNLNPENIRRWFKKNYGITFHAFQRMYRINNAYEELKKGKNTTETAFEMGYDSLSGFGYTYKKIIGNSPSSNNKKLILIDRLTTPIGPMFICSTEKGICLLEFTNRKMLETELKDLQKRLNAKIISGENKFIAQAKNEISEYFNGNRKTFNIQLDTPGTDFQNLVWKELLKIPYGKTISYKTQAKSIGKEKAVRAVANANGHNKISIIIPCHRVIGSDGKLTGYGGGIERKKWLLDFEKNNFDKSR